MGFQGSFSTAYSDSSSAASQAANNQDFEKVFDVKNLGSTDILKPSILAVGFVALYFFLKKKGLV